jgi:hypothetical protein
VVFFIQKIKKIEVGGRGRALSAQAPFFYGWVGPQIASFKLHAARETVFTFCFFLWVGGPSAHKHNFWLYAAICRIDSGARLCKRKARPAMRRSVRRNYFWLIKIFVISLKSSTASGAALSIPFNRLFISEEAKSFTVERGARSACSTSIKFRSVLVV